MSFPTIWNPFPSLCLLLGVSSRWEHQNGTNERRWKKKERGSCWLGYLLKELPREGSSCQVSRNKKTTFEIVRVSHAAGLLQRLPVVYPFVFCGNSVPLEDKMTVRMRSIAFLKTCPSAQDQRRHGGRRWDEFLIIFTVAVLSGQLLFSEVWGLCGLPCGS